MLYFVTKARHSRMIWDFIIGAGRRRLPFLTPLSYDELFYSRKAPLGNYIFTDFDRMTAYEVACAARLAAQLRAADPLIRIYNDPIQSLERVPLLSRLQQTGINDFGVTRIDTGVRPPAYPVFIRCEDDAKAPESGLLQNDDEYDAALADLARRGIPTKRRIAVQFRAKRAQDGYFRKYGAVKIGKRITLQHIQRNTEWRVKRGGVEPDAVLKTEYNTLFEDFAHGPELDRVFAIAGLDYGRADYTIIDDRIQIYEINTNPTLPVLSRQRDAGRYARLGPWLIAAFANLDGPHATGRAIRFKLASPRFQRFSRPSFASRRTAYRFLLKAAISTVRRPIILGFENST